MAYPRFQRSRSFKFLTRTAGSLSNSSTSWTDLTTALDITLNAQVGDVIEYGINGLWDNAAVQGGLDVATIVSGSPVSFFQGANNNATDGVASWVGLASVFTGISGSVLYQVQAGDLSAGTVTLRLRVKNLSASAKQIFAIPNDPLQLWAKNLGPVDPS